MRHPEHNLLLSRKRQPAGYSFSSKNYDRFQLIFVQHGVMEMHVHNRDYSLAAGQMAILRKGSRFRLFSDEGYSGLGIIAEGDLPPSLSGETSAVQADIQTRTTAELLDYYLLKPDDDSKRVIRALSHALLAQAMGLEKKQQATHKEKWPEIAKAVLDVNLSSGLSAREALSHIPLCYRQLSRHFTSKYGVSPKQYQVSARINEAKRMLANSALTITDIAMELGFSSSQHFATQFKHTEGTSPRIFRERQM